MSHTNLISYLNNRQTVILIPLLRTETYAVRTYYSVLYLSEMSYSNTTSAKGEEKTQY